MRLSPEEVKALSDSLSSFLPEDFLGELRLYGSRVNDNLKGGDIDLVLLVNKPEHLASLVAVDYKIVAKMKSKSEIGDRKIDFKILMKSEALPDFFIEALKTSILLEKY